MKVKNIVRYGSAVILIGFGLLTLLLSTSIIFDLFGIREKEGNFVMFVVQSNFICSILYLFSAYGFLKIKSWTRLVLGIASIILIVSFILLKMHINNGGSYEAKTVSAMIFRMSFTVVLTLIAYITLKKRHIKELKK